MEKQDEGLELERGLEKGKPVEMSLKELDAIKATESAVETLVETLGDKFAMAALTGLLARDPSYPHIAPRMEYNTQLAYEYAGLMLDQRSKEH